MEIIENEIVIDRIKNIFPQCVILKEWQNKPFWHVEFAISSIIIEIDGDISFDIVLYIDNSKYYLWQYDRKVLDYRNTTLQNIVIQLEILREFILASK